MFAPRIGFDLLSTILPVTVVVCDKINWLMAKSKMVNGSTRLIFLFLLISLQT
jgi:hypothetical protein